jgi:hypothetical protein
MKILILLLSTMASQVTQADALHQIIINFTSKLTWTDPNKVSDNKKLSEKQIRLQTKAAFDNSCLLDEMTISQIENSYFNILQQAIYEQNYPAIEKLNFDQIESFGITSLAQRTQDHISEFSWSSQEQGSLKKRLKEFKKIEYVEIKVIDYKIDPAHRKGDFKFDKSTLMARLDVRGINLKNQLMQDRFKLSISMENKEKHWATTEVTLLKGSTSIQNGQPTFEDITNQSGLSKVSINLRTEAIRRGGYALSVIDYNQDKIPDLFVGHRENAEVFQGNKNGEFTKIVTPFDKEKYSKTAVFADFNNTGRQDVAINRFIASDQNGIPLKNTILPAQVAFYKNTEKGYVEQENKFGGADIYKKPMPSAVADFNGDGLLDIYVGYPGIQDFSQFSQLKKSTLKFQGLYINDGKGGFIDSTEKLDANVTKNYSRLFPHSSLAVDFNQDQKIDLIVLDDRRNLSPVFINSGHGKFTESSKKIGVVNYNYAMSIASADLNNDGLVDLGVTSVNFSEMTRTNSACYRHFVRKIFPDIQGLNLFLAEKNETNPLFKKVSEDNFDDVGEALGGLTFLDYNNDGLVDIYVVNGLWSGTKKGQDFGSFFTSSIRASSAWPMYSLNSKNDLRFMDVLSTFKGSILDYTKTSTIKAGTERPSLAGYQRNRLLRNNGDGTFTDVAYLEGVDSIADGYIVGKIDYNKDGLVDLVLRNADPGTQDYQFPAVQLFKNNSKSRDKSVILTFSAEKLNKEGIGLFVKAYAREWTQVSHLEGNSGSMQ